MKKMLCLVLSILLIVSAAVVASAEGFDWAGSGTVTVYCGHDKEMGDKIAAAFTEKTGVKVETVYGGGGELMARVEAEKDNPLCDVVYGVSADLLAGSNTDLFEKYTIESVTPSQIGLTEEAFGEDYWFVDAGRSIMVLMINTDLMPVEEAPKSWKELTDEKYFGKIGFVDPTASSSGYIQLCTMAQLYGWEFVEEFYKNLDGKLQSSSSAVPRGCADGEYPIALTLEHMGSEYVVNGAPVAMMYPEDGTQGATNGSVILKNCKNPENAKLFIEFSYSEEVSSFFSEKYRRAPRADVEQAAGLCPFEEIVFVDYDTEMAANKEANIELWNEIVINN